MVGLGSLEIDLGSLGLSVKLPLLSFLFFEFDLELVLLLFNLLLLPSTLLPPTLESLSPRRLLFLASFASMLLEL